MKRQSSFSLVAVVVVLMMVAIWGMWGCTGEKLGGPISAPPMPNTDHGIVISVDPGDGLPKAITDNYLIGGTFTNGGNGGWEKLPPEGKSFFLFFGVDHSFTVVKEGDWVPITSIKVTENGVPNNPPGTAWLNGNYWVRISFNNPHLEWLKKSDGICQVDFEFETDIQNPKAVKFLGNSTYLFAKDPNVAGWQKVPMKQDGSRYKLTLANAIGVERLGNVVVTDQNSSEQWPPKRLWVNGVDGVEIKKGYIQYDLQGKPKTFQYAWTVYSDCSVQDTGPDDLTKLYGIEIGIKP